MEVAGGLTSTSVLGSSPQRDPDSGPSNRPDSEILTLTVLFSNWLLQARMVGDKKGDGIREGWGREGGREGERISDVTCSQGVSDTFSLSRSFVKTDESAQLF